MAEMKDSGIEWIGKIPEEWSNIKLKSFYDFEKGKNAQLYTAEYIGKHEGQYPVFSGQTENNGVMGFIDTYDYELNECLFTTTVGAKVMTPKLLKGKFSLSQNCLIMKPKKECNNHFFFYCLISLFDYEKGAIPSYMQPSLRIDDLKKYGFYIPDLENQNRIADFLDKKCAEIDTLHSDIEKQIHILEEYKKSIITEAVTKGLDPDVEMKDSGIEWIGKIPKHWKTNKIKYLFASGKGLSITKENLIDEGLPVISYGQIHAKANNGVDINKDLLRFVSYEYQKRNPNCEVKKYDFIFADTSEDYEGCGNCVYKRDDSVLFAGYHSIILHAINQKDNRYLAYLFLTDLWRKQLRETASGVKVFSVTQKNLINSSIILPPEDEQNKIANILDKKCYEIIKAINDKQQQLETLEQYKKSLIYEYVTGKKEVSNE